MDSLGLSYWVDGSDESRIPLTSHVYLTVTVRCYRARTCHDRVLVEAVPVWGPSVTMTTSPEVLREQALGPFATTTTLSVVLRVLVSERGREYRPCS